MAMEWAVRLLPLLSVEAQTAALALPAVKKAVRDRMGFYPEDHRRWFCIIQLGSAGWPFTLAQQLKDTATRWLQPG